MVLDGVKDVDTINSYPISEFSGTLWIITDLPKNQVKQQVGDRLEQDGALPYYRAYLCPREERGMREHKFSNP